MFTRNSVGNLTSAAKAVIDDRDDIYNTARETGVDFGKIAEAAIIAKSAERQAASQNKGIVAEAGVKAFGDVVETNNTEQARKDVANIKTKAVRMAGILGGLGALSTGLILKNNQHKWKTEREPYDTSGIDAIQANVEKNKSLLEQLAQQQQDQKNEPLTYPTVPVPDRVTGPTDTSTAPVEQMSLKLTPLDQQVVEIVGSLEDAGFGYEAFNQGGRKKGHESINPGNWKLSKHSGGKSLTEMPISEVLERGSGHNDWTRYPTQQSWNDQGKLWAAGRFQFIPDTLRAEVKAMGLDTSLPFSKENQIKIFLSHARRNGSFAPWVGTQFASPSQKAVLNQWLQQNR